MMKEETQDRQGREKLVACRSKAKQSKAAAHAAHASSNYLAQRYNRVQMRVAGKRAAQISHGQSRSTCRYRAEPARRCRCRCRCAGVGIRHARGPGSGWWASFLHKRHRTGVAL
jgi:hypothetical protein